MLLVDLLNIQKTEHLLYSVPFCSVLKHGLANTHPHPKHQNTTPDPPHPTTTHHLILNVLLHHLHHNPHHLPLLLTPFLPICRTTLPTPTKTGARSSMIPGGYKASYVYFLNPISQMRSFLGSSFDRTASNCRWGRGRLRYLPMASLHQDWNKQVPNAHISIAEQ